MAPSTSSKSSSPSCNSMKSYPPCPDGGWGWMVVFGSFMIHVIADGISYSIGLFYYEWVNHFGASKTATSMAISIMNGTTYCIGPIASALTIKFGCRAVTIVGALFASLGFLLGAFAPNIYMLYNTIGICAGLGFGLMYLPAIVIVTSYFEKKRAFATGIAVCGSGIGTAIMSPLIEHIISLYGWKKAMLVMSVLILNCAIFGSLFKPVPKFVPTTEKTTNTTNASSMVKTTKTAKKKMKNSKNNQQRKEIDSAATMIVVDNDNDDNNMLEMKELIMKNDSANHANGRPKSALITSSTSTSDIIKEKEKHFLLTFPVPNHGNLTTKSSMTIHMDGNISLNPNNNDNSIDIEDDDNNIEVVDEKNHAEPSEIVRRNELKPRSNSFSPGFVYRDDIFYSGSLMSINRCRKSEKLSSKNSNLLLNNNGNKKTRRRRKRNQNRCCLLNFYDDILYNLTEMFDLSLMKNNIFLLFSISNFLTSIGFYIPYIYLKDWIVQNRIGTELETGYFTSIIGIFSTISRLVFGYLSDQSFVNRLWLYITTVSLCGLIIISNTFATTHQLLFAFCALFGTTCGTYVGLTSVVLVDLLSLEQLTNAFGLILLFQGVASILGPLFIGFIYDLSGTYDTGFQVIGSLVAFSGLMLILIPISRHFESLKKLFL